MRRPLRRDARESRDKLIAAAQAEFAAHGVDASLEKIARDAGVACDLLQGRIHAVGGELGLRCGDEFVAAFPGIAAQGPPHLLYVAVAHSASLPAMVRAASVLVLHKSRRCALVEDLKSLLPS